MSDINIVALHDKESLKTLYEPLSEEKEKIIQLSLYLIALKEKRAHEKSRLQSPGCDLIVEHVQRNIDSLDQQILEVQKEMDELTKTDDNLKNNIETLKEYKGIGDVTALNMAVHLP